MNNSPACCSDSVLNAQHDHRHSHLCIFCLCSGICSPALCPIPGPPCKVLFLREPFEGEAVPACHLPATCLANRCLSETLTAKQVRRADPHSFQRAFPVTLEMTTMPLSTVLPTTQVMLSLPLADGQTEEEGQETDSSGSHCIPQYTTQPPCLGAPLLWIFPLHYTDQ